MKLKPDAILFDMDGVLIDSLDSWWQSLNSALKAFNIKEISKEEFIEKYWGHDLYDNLKSMKLSREIGVLCSNMYSKHIDKIKLYPDTKDTLEKLNRYKKGVITNTPRDCTIHILSKFDIRRYFDTIVTSDEVDKGKPNPDIIFKACKNLNVNPKDVLLVGDTESDIEAGKAAGCIVVGINIDGDFTIKKLSELTKLLE
jgi:HAD superfamily hydrolase (TIGR01509 family)